MCPFICEMCPFFNETPCITRMIHFFIYYVLNKKKFLKNTTKATPK